MTAQWPDEPLPLERLLEERLLFEAGRMSSERYVECLQRTVDELAQAALEVAPLLSPYFGSGTSAVSPKVELDDALTSAMRLLQEGNRREAWTALRRAERLKSIIVRLAECAQRRDELELALDVKISELELSHLECLPSIHSIRRALRETAPSLISATKAALASSLLTQVEELCARLFGTATDARGDVMAPHDLTSSAKQAPTVEGQSRSNAHAMLSASLDRDRNARNAPRSTATETAELIARAERLARDAKSILLELRTPLKERHPSSD